MRRYDHGKIVGTVDPPQPFEDWLRAQIEQAKTIDPSPYVHGRIQALMEVQRAYERAQQGASEVPSTHVSLWVDDERLGPQGWVIATSVKDAIHCISSMGSIDVLSLDFTLGDGTAEDILAWLKCHPEYWPKVVRAHSSSRDGRMLIGAIVERTAPHTTTFEAQ